MCLEREVVKVKVLRIVTASVMSVYLSKVVRACCRHCWWSGVDRPECSIVLMCDCSG